MIREVIAFLAHLALWYPQANTIPPRQIACVAKAVYFEARGEPIIGRIAVANVVMNRVHSDLYPDTACAVVHEKAQFEGVEHGTEIDDEAAWKDAVEIAAFVYIGFINDHTNGALHFIEKDVAKGVYWYKSRKRSMVIGDHVFLTLEKEG